MPKIVFRLCVIAAIAFWVSASSTASPVTSSVVSPTVAASNCTPPLTSLITPSQGLEAWVQLSSGDCWTTYVQCVQNCGNPSPDPQNPCWLACDCAYCVCEGIFCIDECNGGSS